MFSEISSTILSFSEDFLIFFTKELGHFVCLLMTDLKDKALLTENNEISTFIAALEVENDNLILALHAIENRFGYVPRESALLLSRRFAIPLARIYEVITFYHYFRTTPSAENTITICQGTSCWLHGSEKVLQHIHKLLEELTAEQRQRFGLSEVRCVGCCSLAPLIFVSKKVIGHATPEKIKEVITSLLSNRGDVP